LADQALKARLNVPGGRLAQIDHARAACLQLLLQQVEQRLLLGVDPRLSVGRELRHDVRHCLPGDGVLDVMHHLHRSERRVHPAHRPLQVGAAEGRVALPTPLDQVVLQQRAGALVLVKDVAVQGHRQGDLLVLRQRFPQIAQ